MKVLIAEDEDALAEVIKEEFKSEGYDVKIAKDGEEALVLARKIKPDVLLLDLVMPKKDGMTVLAELKADAVLKNIPVIVLSNLAEDENIKKALALGAVDYFVKAQHSVCEDIGKVQLLQRTPNNKY